MEEHRRRCLFIFGVSDASKGSSIAELGIPESLITILGSEPPGTQFVGLSSCLLVLELRPVVFQELDSSWPTYLSPTKDLGVGSEILLA